MADASAATWKMFHVVNGTPTQLDSRSGSFSAGAAFTTYASRTRTKDVRDDQYNWSAGGLPAGQVGLYSTLCGVVFAVYGKAW